jgi:hypothetical protein
MGFIPHHGCAAPHVASHLVQNPLSKKIFCLTIMMSLTTHHAYTPADVFVFGSNLAGRHGKGAALTARKLYGAIYGQGEGRQGRSYAIPTKDEFLRPLPLEAIAMGVEQFISHARIRWHEIFYLTRIGCGLAGYDEHQIAPMFKHAPKNVIQTWQSVEYNRALCYTPPSP